VASQPWEPHSALRRRNSTSWRWFTAWDCSAQAACASMAAGRT